MSRNFFSLALAILLSITTRAKVVEYKKAGSEDPVFEKVSNEVSTNEKAWAEHIKRKTVLPDSVLKSIPAGTYKITVQFIVDKMGNVGQIKALNDAGYGLAQRAENAVLSYKGEWSPAVQCGRNVKAYEKRAIVFTIN